MVTGPTQILTVLSISTALLASSCTKERKKFGLAGPHKEGELIVTLKDDTPEKSAVLNKILQKMNVMKEPLNGRSFLLKFEKEADLQTLAEEIYKNGEVLAVEANQIYKLYEKAPNDPEFGELWGLKNTGQSSGTLGVDIGATIAWKDTTGSKDVLVAVLDSGVDYTHPDLQANIWLNPGETGLDDQGRDKATNGIDDDGNGYVDDVRGYDFIDNDNDPMDEHSHGTHVAGIIGAQGDNGQGISGVAWNASLIPIKVFSPSGSTSTDTLVRGIEYATSLGVFATNNSWGGGEYSEAIYGAIKRSSEKGILFVAAAGNESDDNDIGRHFPSNYDLPNIISVASINRFEEISLFSNYGAKTVDLAAPGEDIYSTYPKGKYGLKSGTSMAAPHVTGSLVLLKSLYPEATAFDLKNKLIASHIPTVALSEKVIYGRINVAHALETDLIPPALVRGVDLQRVGVNNFGLGFLPSGDDGEEGRASSYQIRLSDGPILTEEEWSAAMVPKIESIKEVDGFIIANIIHLPFNSSGYVSIRAVDNVGNQGPISESLSYATKEVITLWSEDNKDETQWAGFGYPWGLRIENDISMLSDSPTGFYANGIDKSSITKDINLESSELVLEITHRYDLEKEFDFGYIDISTDQGLTWKTISPVNGTSDWRTDSYDLLTHLGDKTSFRLRLRIKTDNSLNLEGWDIDSLRIIGAKPE